MDGGANPVRVGRERIHVRDGEVPADRLWVVDHGRAPSNHQRGCIKETRNLCRRNILWKGCALILGHGCWPRRLCWVPIRGLTRVEDQARSHCARTIAQTRRSHSIKKLTLRINATDDLITGVWETVIEAATYHRVLVKVRGRLQAKQAIPLRARCWNETEAPPGGFLKTGLGANRRPREIHATWITRRNRYVARQSWI